MTSRTARASVSVIALLLTAGLLCAGCSLTAGQARPAARPARGTPTASASARPSPKASAPSPAAPRDGTAMPFSQARIQAAASLADRFASDWDSWSWTMPPADWLAVLKPMTAAQMYPALAQAAGTPAVLAQREAARQSASAVVDSAQITGLTPGSVTVTVDVHQDIYSSGGTSQDNASFAVTLVPAGSDWLVWDIEPADTGNS